MFPTRLSEVSASEIQAVIDNEAAETLDFELKGKLPAKRGAIDPWMSGGKLGDECKDELASEIIAFANTTGGTLIVGIGEDTATKRAKPPILPIPRCKEAAARLHQAISDRIEPKLPVLECEGVVTAEDGTSGVIIMRTLESYLAPHRHTQNNHCYVRRNDRAEPMSMLEIQDMTRQKARSASEMEKSFEESSDRFVRWLPLEHLPRNLLQPAPSRDYAPTSPLKELASHPIPGTDLSAYIWGLRVVARPLSSLTISDLPRQPWLDQFNNGSFGGTGQLRYLWWNDLQRTRAWQPRLRAVEREFGGADSLGLDRVTNDGAIERFVFQRQCVNPERQPHIYLNMEELHWNIASVVHAAGIVRQMRSRPTQRFALEIDLLASETLALFGYHGAPSATISTKRTIFPRYEIGDLEGFDELIMSFDKDVWNLGGYHPTWQLGVKWPAIESGLDG